MSKHKSSAPTKHPEHWKTVDQGLFAFGRRLDILDEIRWPESAKESFLSTAHRKRPRIPHIPIKKRDYSEKREQLREWRRLMSGSHPIPQLFRRTIDSYDDALLMLESMGTPHFTECSKRIYGSTLPDEDEFAASTVKLAKRFLTAFRRFHEEKLVPPETICILPDTVAREINKEIKRTFPDEDVVVQIVDSLPSKAAANIKGVKVRNSTCFAPHDIMQLLHHELLVHTLTLLNGRHQPYSTLGVSSPYTTVTQEGLAVFSEFVTNSIDIGRMARLSARVIAIDMALQGADFVEVYKYFVGTRQTEEEAYYSAARIFRGGDGKGGVVFTKDLVYLKGLLQVREFLLNALEGEHFQHPQVLFSGRFCVSDIESITPLFQNGELAFPKYLPEWVKNPSNLLTYLLSFAAFHGLDKRDRANPHDS